MIVMRRSPILDEGDLPDDFGRPMLRRDSPEAREPTSLHEVEKKLIFQALERSRWNKSEAARMLKIPRHVLLYRIKTYGIVRAPDVRGA